MEITNNSPYQNIIPLSGDFNFANGLHGDSQLFVADNAYFGFTDYGTRRMHVQQTVHSNSIPISKSATIIVDTQIVSPEEKKLKLRAELLNLEGKVVVKFTFILFRGRIESTI